MVPFQRRERNLPPSRSQQHSTLQKPSSSWRLPHRFLVAGLSLAMALVMTGCGMMPKQEQPLRELLPLGVLPPSDEPDNPQQLYHEAWQIVQRDYMDPSFNGQDWYRWKDRYEKLLKDNEDAYVAIDTMLASLGDDYTRFLKPREMNEQTLHIDSHLSGVGLQISVKDSKLMVVAPLKDTPAEKAGIRPNDVITQIDGNSTAGISVQEAADRIRGKEGTKVRLTVKRGEKVFDTELVRTEIKLKSVFAKSLVPDEIGYIRLNSFISETALAELRDAMADMKNKRGIILDLRGNYGGLLTNAVEIADLFLNEGTIVSIVGRNRDRQTFSATNGVLLKQPLVVLIDGGSASASEILSGALKDHGRATLVGTRTFGKGLVQKITPMSSGAGMNITISKYFTPRGTDINKKGIEPDIKIALTERDIIENHDVQLQAAVKHLAKETQIASKIPDTQPFPVMQ